MSHSLSIYHLSCSNGTPIFIHPFLNARNILAIQNNTTITGMYGEEPRVEAITMLRNDLYRCIDNAVRDWINERRLIPRFLIAAAVFFLTYIVLAFAVRDPLPVLDELILGIVTAVVTYVLIGRKFENSNRAVKQRIMLREKIDSIVFTEHPYVKKIEAILHAVEKGQEVNASKIWQEDRSHTIKIYAALQKLMKSQPYKRIMRKKKRYFRKLYSAEKQSSPNILVGENFSSTIHIIHLFYILQRDSC